MGEFGDKFRKTREAKKISLDDVSKVTKIGSRMLQAIEQEHFDQLPGGVFNKGFIRAYAKHLGLSEEEAITSYLACLRQAQLDAQAGWDPQARPAPPDKGAPAAPQQPASPPRQSPPAEELPDLQLPRAEHVRPPRRDFPSQRSTPVPWGIVAALALVIVLGVLWWWNHSHASQAGARAQAPSATAQMDQPAVAPPPAQAPPTGASSAGSASSVVATPAPKPEGPVENKLPSAPTAPPNEPTAPLLTLIVRATETSWISLTADGQPIAEETLIAPAHTSIRAHREIMVRVGNAAGVTFLWNGQEIPAQGAEAEVKTLVFDSAGMHAVPSQPPVPNQ